MNKLMIAGFCVASVLAVRADSVLNFARQTMAEGAIGTDVQSPTGEDDSYTWEAWVYFTAQEQVYGGHFILSQGDDASGTITLRTYQKHLSVVLKGKGDVSGGTFLSTYPAWHHVAMVKTPTEVKLYLDGALEATLAASQLSGAPAKIPALPSDVCRRFNIGGMKTDRFTGSSITFGGQMAEIRLWGVERSGEEIAATKGCRLTGREAGLLGYWPISDAEVGGTTFRNYVTGADMIIPATRSGDVTNVTVAENAALPVTGTVGDIETPVKCLDLNTKNVNPEQFVSRYTYIRSTDDFTFEAWLKLKPEIETIANYNNATGTKLFRQYYGGGAGRMEFTFLNGGYAKLWYNGPGNASCNVQSTEKFPVGTWTHLAVTAKDGEQKIYFNGREVASAANPYAGFYQPPECTSDWVGAMFNVASAFAEIREERLWHVCRTADEVRTWLYSTLTGDERGLSFYNGWSKDSNWGGYANEVRHSSWKDVDQVPWPISGEGPWINFPSGGGNFIATRMPLPSLGVDPMTAYASMNGTMGAYVDTKTSITTRDFTFETWVFPREFDQTIDVIAAQYNGGADGRMNFGLKKGIPYFGITTSDSSSGKVGDMSAALPIPLFRWTHLAVTREGGTWTIYVNGQPVVSESGRTTCMVVSGRTFNLGHCSVVQNDSCTASLAEARLWDYARTPREIARFYKDRMDGTHEHLVGCWPLVSNAGRDVADKTGKTSTGVANVAWLPAVPLVFRKESSGWLDGLLLLFK